MIFCEIYKMDCDTRNYHGFQTSLSQIFCRIWNSHVFKFCLILQQFQRKCCKLCHEIDTKDQSVPYFLRKCDQSQKSVPYNVSLRNVTACNLAFLPVNCLWGNWESWESCSATCGGGTQQRSRVVVRQAQNGGRPCTGGSTDEQSCSTQSCVPPGNIMAPAKFGSRGVSSHLVTPLPLSLSHPLVAVYRAPLIGGPWVW